MVKIEGNKFNARSTAQEVLEGVDLTGKVAIVTGGNSGIGFVSCRELAKAGARVLMCCRTPAKAEAAKSEIMTADCKGSVDIVQLDLMDLDSAVAAAQKILSMVDRIDILLLNAGMMSSPELKRTKQGFESSIGVCHFGHVKFATPLIEKMKPQKFQSRIITITSISAFQTQSVDFNDLNYVNRKFDFDDQYNVAKLCCMWYAFELQKRVQNTNILVYPVSPGVISTNFVLHNSFYNLIIKKVPMLGNLVLGLYGEFIKSADQGASTSLFAAVSPLVVQHKGKHMAHCDLGKTTPYVNDEKNALKLWQATEELLKRAAAGENVGIAK